MFSAISLVLVPALATRPPPPACLGCAEDFSCDDGLSLDQERMEPGVNIFVTSGLLCVTAIYFSVIDPLRPAGSSVTVLVRRTFERTSRSSGYAMAS